jgi:diguanylate cyclase (GGDEF)-like protein
MNRTGTTARRLADLEAENRALREEVAHWRQRAEQLDRLADQDPLTGLLNRRAFIRELSRGLAFCRRYAATGSLLYLDVDNLKQINDGHGHGAGDAALLHVAEVLTANTRACDLVGRIGGDEFAVVLQQAGADAANRKADELRRRAEAEPVLYHGARLTVSLSVGQHLFDGTQTPEATIDGADRAMYAGRQRGRASR